jgi:hypothetical protein
VALLCGVAAALPLTMTEPWETLGQVRSGRTMHGGRTRYLLVVAETAVALMLAIASMLMVRTIRTFATLDLGFDPRGVITAALPRPPLPATDAERLARMHQLEAEVIEAVRQVQASSRQASVEAPWACRSGSEASRCLVRIATSEQSG